MFVHSGVVFATCIPFLVKVIFTVIVIMEILSSAEIDICVPSFPELQSVFHVGPFAVEFILGINLFAHCCGALIAGSLGDRYGRKPVILAGMLIFILGCVVCLCARSYPVLLLGRLIQGIGISCPAVLAYVTIPDTFDIKTHQRLLGTLNFFTTLAMAAAPVVGSFVNLFFGWHGNFTLLLVLGIACFVLGALFLPPGKGNGTVSISLMEYVPVLKNIRAMHFVLTICSMVVGYWVFIALAPLLYVKNLGVKLQHFGWYQGSLAATFALVSISSEKLLGRFGEKRLFFAGMGLVFFSAICIVLLAALKSKNPLLITLSMILMSAGIIFPCNILSPHAFEAAPDAKGKLGALIVFVKLISISFFVQFVSFFYAGSFCIIGLTMASILIFALISGMKLVKGAKFFAQH